MPIPTFPFASIMKAVEVEFAVDVAVANNARLSRVAVEVAAIERRAKGEVEPMPTEPEPAITPRALPAEVSHPHTGRVPPEAWRTTIPLFSVDNGIIFILAVEPAPVLVILPFDFKSMAPYLLIVNCSLPTPGASCSIEKTLEV